MQKESVQVICLGHLHHCMLSATVFNNCLLALALEVEIEAHSVFFLHTQQCSVLFRKILQNEVFFKLKETATRGI